MPMKVLFNARRIYAAALFFSLFSVPSPAQSTPVPVEYRKFIQRVDQRGEFEKFFNSWGIPVKPVGKSFALIAGVAQYPKLEKAPRFLPPAALDIQNLVEYLKTAEFFDEIVVLQDGDVTLENLNYFLENYFPEQVAKVPHSRFLFAYSGHGFAVQRGNGSLRGYLLKSSATTLDDRVNSIDLNQLHVALGPVIESAEKVLVLINSCQSGVFLRRPFGPNPVALSPLGPGEKGAHAIMASRADQKSWQVEAHHGSIFFEKILAGLKGAADANRDGIVTFGELSTYLRREIPIATDKQQTPMSGDLASDGSTGEFFFLNRAVKVQLPNAKPLDPRTVVTFGKDGTEDFQLDPTKSPEDEFDLGRMAYIAGHFEEAALHLRRGAEAGNPDAMNRLGFLYAEGRGVPQDYEKARQWYEKAALRGSVNAMVDLAVLYDNGQGGRIDHSQARQWYEKAAATGSGVAMDNLGYVYENGLGVKQDYALARQWYEKGAATGDADCMKNIGILYQLGNGVKQDYDQARQWYEKAATAGSAAAMNNLGTFYFEGQRIKQDYALARQWYEKGASAGDAGAMFNLGFLYANGYGVTKDYERARQWYEKAAAAGNATAMQNLGAMYANGQGVAQDYVQALQWVQKAAAAGSKEAQEMLKSLPK